MIDPEHLRIAMRKWASGVTLVTACEDSDPHGMTVSSFTSVSLDPPLILVSLAVDTRTHSMVRNAGAFAVSILAEDQRLLADRFAGLIPDGGDRFAKLDYTTGESGSPILSDCLAYFDCRVVGAHTEGTQTIFIGRVLEARVVREGRPLLYFNRAYHQLGEKHVQEPSE